MTLFCGLDLHVNNTYAVVSDERDKVLLAKRLPNELKLILEALEPFRQEMATVAVESTFNWYWLVDGLMEADFPVLLVNTNAVRQYNGLKFTDDRHDARWLAHLARLGILPTGYIYPKQQRPVRDLLRKRCKLVRQRTANWLSVQNLLARNTGEVLRANALKKLTSEEIARRVPQPHLALAMDSTLVVIAAIQGQVRRLEQEILAQAKLNSQFRILKTIPGVGDTLALTIMYETGDVQRFPTVGDYVSYCRCVPSHHRSNGKKKGEGNTRNGNPYLSWAYAEAATFARRFQPPARRYYDRKQALTHPAVAAKALAHKLARASYWMMRNQTAYDPSRLFH